MDSNDLLTIKSLSSSEGMTPFEQAMLADKSSKRINGSTATALGIGIGGLAIGIGAWIFGGVYSAARANGNQQMIEANKTSIDNTMAQLANVLAAERAERVANQSEVNRTVVDIYNNAASAATSSANASSSAYSQAEAQIVSDRLTGRSQMCPTPVSLYSSPQPCSCPNSCGCSNS